MHVFLAPDREMPGLAPQLRELLSTLGLRYIFDAKIGKHTLYRLVKFENTKYNIGMTPDYCLLQAIAQIVK